MGCMLPSWKNSEIQHNTFPGNSYNFHLCMWEVVGEHKANANNALIFASPFMKVQWHQQHYPSKSKKNESLLILVPYPPCNSPPLQTPLPQGGKHHFDISSRNGWLYCALLFFLCKCPLSELISPIIQFGVVKRSFTQCLWKGHMHRSNIMFQHDLHYQCCACTAAVLKCYGLVVQSPPPQGGGRLDIGGKITSGEVQQDPGETG